MTRDEILKMKAGREMDALVAERVMGAKWRELINGRWLGKGDGGFGIDDKRFLASEHAYYSILPRAAQEVTQRIKELNKVQRFMENLTDILDLQGDEQGYFEEELFKIIEASPAAICRAALLAVMEAQ